MLTCNGTFTTTDYDPTRALWTAGVNRELARDLSAYGRIDHGIHFLNFNNVWYSPTGQTPPELSIENVEIGLKYQVHWIYADVAAYRKIFSGLTYTPTNAQGVQLPGPPEVFGADSKGLNAIMVVTPIGHFRLRFIGNYFDGRYSHINACIPFVSPVTGPGSAFIDGKPLQRQPKAHLAFTPSYVLVLCTWRLMMMSPIPVRRIMSTPPKCLKTQGAIESRRVSNPARLVRPLPWRPLWGCGDSGAP